MRLKNIIYVFEIVTWSNSTHGYTLSSFQRQNDSFYVILKRTYSFHRDSNPWSVDYEANSLPLSYLTCWWMSIKVAYIKSQIVYKSINCTQLSQNDKLWTIWNKMLHKNSSNINISYHRCLFHKHVTRMLQQEGILSILKRIFFRHKMCWDFVTSCYYHLLLQIDEVTKFVMLINNHIPLCMSWCYTYKNHLDRFSGCL